MKGEKRLLAHVHGTPSHVYSFFFYVCTTRLQLFFSISNVDKCCVLPPYPPTFDLPTFRVVHSVMHARWCSSRKRGEKEEEERKKATAQSNVNPKRVIFK